MGAVMAFSVVMAVVIFMIVPLLLANFLRNFISSETLMAFLEGVIRLGIFIGYVLLVSRMEEIHRTFMYHGAEHKCINCVEHGMELNVENVRKSSRLRLAGRSDGGLINLISKPGLWTQGLTTKEPDDSMIEVAIAAVEEVFDWRAYLAENFPENREKEKAV